MRQCVMRSICMIFILASGLDTGERKRPMPGFFWLCMYSVLRSLSHSWTTRSGGYDKAMVMSGAVENERLEQSIQLLEDNTSACVVYKTWHFTRELNL